ncbi:predicted protein [Coccidioides posadasii str. Silveira]|uniref:Predicted protein n=1 Tax=Coccidioides posadasii (strain RMSCC 757 / Silveira) TaxID=443226 RepID=E9D3M8_COCPS|nr:predicted protein [Coccidioides posadasii str. Silveira]
MCSVGFLGSCFTPEMPPSRQGLAELTKRTMYCMHCRQPRSHHISIEPSFWSDVILRPANTAGVEEAGSVLGTIDTRLALASQVWFESAIFNPGNHFTWMELSDCWPSSSGYLHI